MHIDSSIWDRWQSLTVLVIGDVMLDRYLQGSADRLCPEAPVPVVAVQQVQEFPGGAANTAANLASLGAKTRLLSVVGEDANGEVLLRLLRQRGVMTEAVMTTADRETLAKQRVMANDQLLLRFDQGTTTALSDALEDRLCEQLQQVFPECEAVIVSDYGYGILTPRVIETLAELQITFPRVLTIDSKQLSAYRSLRAIAVKPNYQQAVQLLDLTPQSDERASQLEPYGDRLLTLTGAELVAVTLDSEGAIVFEQGKPFHRTEVEQVASEQTSGAGDTYLSALTLALTAGTSVETAIDLATTATAIVVKQPQTSVCQLSELQDALAHKLESTVT